MVQLLTTGPFRGKYYDCYLLVYIHLSFVVGAHVRAEKSAVLAAEMMEDILGILGVVHADRGTRVESLLRRAILIRFRTPKPRSTTNSELLCVPFAALGTFSRGHDPRNVFNVQPLDCVADSG
jgi:hypothetical protein